MVFQDIEPEESSEFRSESFVDTITGISFQPKTIGENVIDMVTFEFGEGSPLDFFEPEDWGALKSFSGIGRVIHDLKKSGIKFQVDMEARGIQTVPSVIGAKVSFKCTKNEKTVKGEVKTYTNWNIDNIQLPEGNEESTSTDVDDTELMDTTIENISTILRGHPCTMRDIIKNYGTLEPDRNKRLPQLKIKEAALDIMEADGIVEKKGEEYHLIEE